MLTHSNAVMLATLPGWWLPNAPLLLDVFCGQGGASMGYRRAGFNVIGCDIKPQPRYPFLFVQMDALEFIRRFGSYADAIHASPPCQFGTKLSGRAHHARHTNLIPDTRTLLKLTGKPFVIENTPDNRHELESPIKLCGSAFGLRVFRHRYFELGGFDILMLPPCQHDFRPVLITGVTTRQGEQRRENTAKECRDASGLHWMTRRGMDQAIPPAYAQWIGEHLIHILRPSK